jgi:hypothetical protein
MDDYCRAVWGDNWEAMALARPHARYESRYGVRATEKHFSQEGLSSNMSETSDTVLGCFRGIRKSLEQYCSELSQAERAAAGMTNFFYPSYEKACADQGRSMLAVMQVMQKFEEVKAAVDAYRKQKNVAVAAAATEAAEPVAKKTIVTTTPLELLSRYMELNGEWRRQYARNKLFPSCGSNEHVIAAMACMKETDNGYAQRLATISAMLTLIEGTE